MIGPDESAPGAMSLAERLASLAQSAKVLALRVSMARDRANSNERQPGDIRYEGDNKSEVMANLSLAVRHLEDAESRLLRAWSNTNHS